MPSEATPSQVKRGARIAALEAEGKFEEAAEERLLSVADEDKITKAQEAADKANKEAGNEEEVEAAEARREAGMTGTEESTTGGKAGSRTSSAAKK